MFMGEREADDRVFPNKEGGGSHGARVYCCFDFTSGTTKYCFLFPKPLFPVFKTHTVLECLICIWMSRGCSQGCSHQGCSRQGCSRIGCSRAGCSRQGCSRRYLTKHQRKKAVEIFETEYVKYFRTAETFESNSAERRGTPVAERKDKNSQETLPSMASASSKMLLRGFTNSSHMSTGGDNTWSSDVSEDEDTTRSQLSTVEIKAIAKKVLKESERL